MTSIARPWWASRAIRGWTSPATNKINSALATGGPDLMVQTIESSFGVHIDYWAITTFWGFKAMIDKIGGLAVNVPFRMLDSYSGVDLHAGAQRL
ncbi:MAG: hypothetical protein E6G00_14150, partial [Actinobacteria bacterium]